jgi:hypothetical protein
MSSARDIMLEPFLAITVLVKAPALVTDTSHPADGEAGRVIVRPPVVTEHLSRLESVLLVEVVVTVYWVRYVLDALLVVRYDDMPEMGW